MGTSSRIYEAVAVAPVRKTLFFAAALLGLLVIFGASGDTVFAKGKPVSFTAFAAVGVTGLDPSDVIPAGNSGRVRILVEQLAGAIGASTDARLEPSFGFPKILKMEQSSNELFSSNPFTDPFGTTVIDGNSHGSFVISDPVLGGAVVAAGKYNVRVSSTAGCQIFDEGNWSTTGGDLKGRGMVTACLNFGLFDFDGPGPLPPVLTFNGPVTFTGTLN